MGQNSDVRQHALLYPVFGHPGIRCGAIPVVAGPPGCEGHLFWLGYRLFYLDFLDHERKHLSFPIRRDSGGARAQGHHHRPLQVRPPPDVYRSHDPSALASRGFGFALCSHPSGFLCRLRDHSDSARGQNPAQRARRLRGVRPKDEIPPPPRHLVIFLLGSTLILNGSGHPSKSQSRREFLGVYSGNCCY